MSRLSQDVEKTVYGHPFRGPTAASLDSEKTLDPVEDAIDTEVNASSTHKMDVSDPGPPPNGGFQAWLQVAGSFFLFFNCWGTINAFGVFQTYYETNPYWSRNASDISWIGSLQAFLLLLVGVVSGPLYDSGYFRHLLAAGTFLVPFGFMMTSLCREYWQAVLAQGIVVGIGNGCLFVPSVAILPQYFSTRKALANGVAASGSSIGGIIYPIVFRRLLVQIGFGWATRVVGFIALAGLSFSILVMRQRVQSKGKRKLTQLSAFKEPPYLLFTTGMFFAFMGFYGPLYYVQTYAISKGITDENLGFYLLPILNALAVPGRILPNMLSDYVGPLNVIAPEALLTGTLSLIWIGINNLGGIITFCALYGFFSGGLVSLPAVAITSLTKDMRYLGTRLGQTFFACSFGLLIGSPVCGAIYSRTGSFLGLQLFSGLSVVLTACLLWAARVAAVGPSLKRKA